MLLASLIGMSFIFLCVSNTQDEEKGDSKSLVKAHDSNDDTTSDHTPLASTGPLAVSDDDNAVIASDEGSSGRVLKRSHSLDPWAFSLFSSSLSVGCPSIYFTQLNANSTLHDANVPNPSEPIYVLSLEYCTCSNVRQGHRENSQDMFKIKLVRNMVLGQEVISWLDENETLHLENYGLHDEFKKVYELVKSFVVLSGGVSYNVQSFHDQYVKLLYSVVELEKVSLGADMVSQVEMDNIRVNCPLCKMKRFRGKCSWTGEQVTQTDGDMSWVLLCGISKWVDKLIAESSVFGLST
ncbi:unnamed protein product [Lactuca saligna]|uniref:Uncharacterized protein n=1 Tax=Lactuca saligna TaxID=75948 RepID=A0AA35YWS3_LACSI|nr:unnamed protein product [Lactuca saligna]